MGNIGKWNDFVSLIEKELWDYAAKDLRDGNPNWCSEHSDRCKRDFSLMNQGCTCFGSYSGSCGGSSCCSESSFCCNSYKEEWNELVWGCCSDENPNCCGPQNKVTSGCCPAGYSNCCTISANTCCADGYPVCCGTYPNGWCCPAGSVCGTNGCQSMNGLFLQDGLPNKPSSMYNNNSSWR